ncbi:MAG: GWxTD domain-containing protein [Rhodothermales bacterium]
MKTLTPLVPLLLLFILPQQAAGQADTSLVEVDIDYAAFAYDEHTSLLEVYFAFGAASLPFESDEQGYRASLPLDVALLHSTEATLPGTPSEPLWQDALILDFATSDTTGLSQGQYFVRQARLPVTPGEYVLRVIIAADPSRGRSKLELRRDVLVPDFVSNDLVGLSDITLATTIARSDNRNDQFYKNGLLIHPNANQLYGQGLTTLYYYAEAYNVDGIASDAGQYTLFAYVAEANKPQPLPGLQRRSQRKARTPDVLAGTFKLDALPSGSYFLRLALLNEDNEAIAEQARKFFVFNPQVAREPIATLEPFEQSPYATMSEEEVEKGLEHINIIATDQERRRARNIQDLDEKRRFLMDFWQRRDPDPSTPTNEFREEFYGRLQYANQRYTSSFQEGWKSDRGRIIVKYGAPGQIEPHLYDRDTIPHEIWQYNNIPGEGQALFIFADRQGFGEFELLHSTVTSERKMANWEEELRRQF